MTELGKFQTDTVVFNQKLKKRKFNKIPVLTNLFACQVDSRPVDTAASYTISKTCCCRLIVTVCVWMLIEMLSESRGYLFLQRQSE